MALYPSALGKLTANRFNRLCAPLHLALDINKVTRFKMQNSTAKFFSKA